MEGLDEAGGGDRGEANRADFGRLLAAVLLLLLLGGGTGEGDCLMNGLLRTVPILESVHNAVAIWMVVLVAGIQEYS